MDNRTPVHPSEWLYRRAYAQKNYLNPDGSATSRCFVLRATKNETELSVDVCSLSTPENSIKDPEKYALFKLRNQSVLDLELSTYHDPLNLEEHGEDNLAHALIFGLDPEDDILPKELAKASLRVHFG